MQEKNKEQFNSTSEQNSEEPETSTETGEESETSNTDIGTEEGAGQDIEALKKEKEELEKKNRQLYERARKSEAQLKKEKAVETAKEKEREGEPDTSNSVDIYEVAKQVSALKDYTPKQLEIIERQAKALGLSHTEAVEHEDVQTLINAQKEKDKDNIPTPSTRQQTEKKDVSQLTAVDIAKLDPVNNPEDAELIRQYNEQNRK